MHVKIVTDVIAVLRAPPLPGDCSVNTYRGAHTLLSTLIRARFSPLELTGQRYLYVGSATGEIVRMHPSSMNICLLRAIFD